MAFNNISFSAALVATAIVLFTATTTVNGKAKNPCEVADDKPQCIALTNGAKTWKDAMINAPEAAIKKIEDKKSMVDGISKKLPASLAPISKKSIGDACKYAYELVIDQCKDNIVCAKTGEDGDSSSCSLESGLSSIIFADCGNALEDFRVTLPEVSEFNTEINKLVATMLSIYGTKN